MKVRITVSLTEAQVAAANRAVEAGYAGNVSDYVGKAIDAFEGVEKTWDEVVEEVLEATGGPLTSEEIEYVDGVLEGRIDGLISFEDWMRSHEPHA